LVGWGGGYGFDKRKNNGYRNITPRGVRKNQAKKGGQEPKKIVNVKNPKTRGGDC